MPIVAGPPGFITLSNLIVGNDASSIYARCDTDGPIRLTYRMWREKDPSVVYTETESAAAVGKRYQTLPRASLGAMDFSGEIVFVEISATIPPNPVGTPILRSQVGSCRVTGARTTTNGKAVPVRWNTFGDGTRPPGGGGVGNWSSYTWAQYNPKGTTYPTP